MAMHLDQLKVNESATVLAVSGATQVCHRLRCLGITPGTRIICRKFAPLGDPMEIRVRHFSLSIRKRDARCVLIQPADPDPAEVRSAEPGP